MPSVVYAGKLALFPASAYIYIMIEWKHLLKFIGGLCAAALTVCSCAGDTDHEKTFPEDLKILEQKLDKLKETGQMDSIIITASPYFYRSLAVHDTMGIQLAGTRIVEAYVLMDKDYDSTARYLAILKPYMENGKGYGVTPIIYYNLLGHIALKYNLDYPAAVNSYMNAYRYAKETGSINNQITMLYNIVNIFYMRNDSHGDRYAEEAVQLSLNPSVSTFYRTAACICMAQTRLLSSYTDEAYSYLKQAHETAVTAGQMDYWAPLIYLIYGDIFTVRKDYDRAKRCYGMALTYSDICEPSLISQIYLNYGKVYELSGEKVKAAQMYMEGLRISQSTDNLEFRKDLLQRSAVLLYDLGNKNMAADYYKKLQIFIDSIYLDSKEKALDNTLIEFSDMQHDLQIAQYNMDLYKMRSRYHLTLMVASLAVLLVIFILILFLRKKRTEKEAVERHMEYNKRLVSENRKQDALRQSTDSQDIYDRLYQQMEDLMCGGAWKDKELSLEKMTEMLASNRTYVSNVINRMAGASFYDYVNSYRIKEAVRILSDPILSQKINIKQLSDEIGFSSPSIFYRVFKRETGVSPGVYKTEAVKLNQPDV